MAIDGGSVAAKAVGEEERFDGQYLIIFIWDDATHGHCLCCYKGDLSTAINCAMWCLII